MQNCADCGISTENIVLDYSKVIERKNQTIEKLKKGIELALKNSKVTVVKAEAQLINTNTIKADDVEYNCEKVICATGSSPRLVKGLEFDHEFLLSSDDILNMDKLPQSILIIGSGAIGIEWARIMSNFGVETTVVELAPHLLPLADIEVSKRIERIFKTRKIKFYTETSVEKVDYDAFLVHVADISCIDDTARRISRFMEKAHKEAKDWEVFVPLEILRQREATQNIFTIVMSSIAGISLLVGGIGIMNIMLANVYERKKEIGTRRALGALKSDIILQFLLETVFLTTVGGLAGVGLGVGIAFAVTFFAVWPVVFSTSAIILSLAISAITGIVFGTYPAWKAAQQNPIDVLRSE